MTQQDPNLRAFFAHIKGNDLVKNHLINMVRKGSIGQSLLFAGPEEASKDQFALALAKLLMGPSSHSKIDSNNHPDLHVYYPEGKIGMHSIASLRQFSEEVYLPSYEAPWKVFIIHDAERMLSYSANALLKTFEEPPLNSMIILLSSHPETILKTILSRCRIVRFLPVEKNLQKKSSLSSEILAILAQGRMRTYSELSKCAAQVADRLEEMQKKEEEILKQEMKRWGEWDLMNATQKQAMEKEMEGILSVRFHQGAKSLFKDILSWYRDLHLIHTAGSFDLLENKEKLSDLMQAYQRGQIPALEVVESKIKNALMAHERSTSFNLCLEKLLLELQVL